MQKAEIELKLYGPREAISTVTKALKLNRKNSEYYNRIGSYYESSGYADSAIFMYNIAIKYAKTDTIKYAYILNRGTAKTSKRDFVNAKTDYESVLEFNPNDIGTLNNIAHVYRELGMSNKGIQSLKKIIQLDSSFVGSYLNLGFCYSEMDSLKQALYYFNFALKLDPKEAVAYNNRGHLYYKLKNYAAALKDINYSISLYPTNSYAYRNLALVYLATNKTYEACETLKFAKDYEFEKRYGDEVNILISKHCK
jgi:tetratricopeptide (TPR) repeat protein